MFGRSSLVRPCEQVQWTAVHAYMSKGETGNTARTLYTTHLRNEMVGINPAFSTTARSSTTSTESRKKVRPRLRLLQRALRRLKVRLVVYIYELRKREIVKEVLLTIPKVRAMHISSATAQLNFANEQKPPRLTHLENLHSDTTRGCVLDVIRLCHLVPCILVESVRVKHHERERQDVWLI